ncbi:MAG: universal stress protein [Burkholderiales bacterium]|nr:universal stress protein [Burkholderiales bacterium]
MLEPKRILLASHGTRGARAADHAALALCNSGCSLFHLVVVPDLWKGMMGDDWLNNASTRSVYARHVESQLAQEIDLHLQALAQDVREKAIRYESKIVLGRPAECLIEYALEIRPDIVVIGAPRPRGQPGLRSRMRVEQLIAGIGAPLLVIPHPA